MYSRLSIYSLPRQIDMDSEIENLNVDDLNEMSSDELEQLLESSKEADESTGMEIQDDESKDDQIENFDSFDTETGNISDEEMDSASARKLKKDKAREA